MSKTKVAYSPCATCPFRKDQPIYLRTERREEIADALADGRAFWCHGTVEWGEDEEGEPHADTQDAIECAGALKALAHVGGSTQLSRIAERLGMADLDRTEASPVEVWSLDDWKRLAEGSTGAEPVWEIEDAETCSTVNYGCLAPAGFMTASGAAVTGTVGADGECATCGEPLCSNCADSKGNCHMCTDEDEDGY